MRGMSEHIAQWVPDGLLLLSHPPQQRYRCVCSPDCDWKRVVTVRQPEQRPLSDAELNDLDAR